MEPHFLICGLGRIGWRVLEYLRNAGFAVVALDTNCAPNDARLGTAPIVKGDCRQQECLLEAGLMNARGVLIMTNDDLMNISTALIIRRLHPTVRIVMRLYNENLIQRLGKTLQNVTALSTANLTAPLFALTALTGQALGTIRFKGAQEGLRQVAELTITQNSPLRGKRIETVTAGYELLVVAHLPRGGEAKLLQDVDEGAQLLLGDRVIVCAEPRDLAPLLTGSDDLFADVRWASLVRRWGRMVWRAVAEVDLAVKLCASVFFTVVILSTLVFHYGVTEDESFARAFYRTVSLMTTAADMHKDQLKTNYMIAFGTGLRIAGALLTAAFTAIVTNYLLRARLGGVLEVRRIPDSGHVIVVGLGNIGFAVVEELVKMKERVVVIEQDKDNKFVTSARRLGAPVLIGDAAVSHVLLQAHVLDAQAVILATSNDLANLEIALLVRELKPTMRVVVHLSEPVLAETLREGANIRLALSIPTLAAPAFVAALFGDRVQSVFLVNNRRIAATDLVISPQDPCLQGHSVRSVAVDYRLLPVAVLDEKGEVLRNPLDVTLRGGYHLVAMSTLADLERLLRREPANRDVRVEIPEVAPGEREKVAALIASLPGAEVEESLDQVDGKVSCLVKGLSRGDAEEMVIRARQYQVTVVAKREGAAS